MVVVVSGWDDEVVSTADEDVAGIYEELDEVVVLSMEDEDELVGIIEEEEEVMSPSLELDDVSEEESSTEDEEDEPSSMEEEEDEGMSSEEEEEVLPPEPSSLLESVSFIEPSLPSVIGSEGGV